MQDNISSFDNKAVTRAKSNFLNRTYAWMVAGLLTTALTSFLFLSSGLFVYFFEYSFLMWGTMLGTLGLVIYLSARIEKMSKSTAIAMFLIYSAMNGLMFSSIFLVYTGSSIATVFLMSAGMFGALSLWGFITKRDLTGLGTFMFMGLIGLIIVAIVNMFVQSSMLYWMQSVFGVLIFAGLTAYDTQKLKKMATENFASEDMAAKMSIMGALTLYLDFINLFIYLLRIFGDRR